MSGARRDAAILLAAAVVLILSWRTTASPPTPPRAPRPTDFSLDHALAHVRVIARKPHPTGSAELARVRRYILAQLAALHVPAETLATTAVGTRYPVAGTVTNIVAQLPGAYPDRRAVLLVAHYDGVAAGPAAADDGSGVAILLETLRALQAGAPPAHDVMALFTDGEEAGLLGAAAFATQDPRARNVAVVVNLEARGSGGRSLVFETSPGDLHVVRALARVVPDATGTSFLSAIYRLLPNDTDFSELARLGVPGLNFAFIGRVLTYHTPSDDLGHLDPASLAHQGRAALALARSFGTSGALVRTSRDATFFNVPLVGMIAYPASWGPPLVALTTTILLLAIALGVLRRRFRMRDPAIGAAGLIVTMVATTAACLLVWLGARRFHAARPDGGFPEWSGLYLGALTLLAGTIAITAARLVRRWTGPLGLTAGALLVWVAAAILAGVVLPGASYAFAWPALIGGVAMAVDAAAPGQRLATRLASRAAGIVAGGLAVVFATQIVALVFQGLGLVLPGICAVTVLAILVLWPGAAWLTGLDTGRWWIFPATGGLGFICLLALGLVTVRNDARRPRRDLVVYSLDAGTHTARWYASAADPYTTQFVGPAPPRVQPTGVERLALGVLARPGGVRSAPAQDLALGAPRVQVVTDSLGHDGRTLVLRITPARSGADLLMRIAGEVVRTARVNGRAVTATWRRRRARDWHLTYVNPDRDGVLLRLEVQSTGPLHFEVGERSDGLPKLPGGVGQPRPPDIEAIQLPDATVVFRDVVL